MRVDDLRGTPRVLRVDASGDEHRAVAERTRVVDRRDLADDPVPEQLLGACHGFRFAAPGSAAARAVRARLEREGALQQVQELPVNLIEGPGGARGAGGALGDGGAAWGVRGQSPSPKPSELGLEVALVGGRE